MGFALNASSNAKMKGVNPDLVRVVNRAALLCGADFQFVITCGKRTVEEQRKLVKIGASKTMNSRHIPARNGLSHAVDFAVTVNGKVRWDWPLYHKLAKLVKEAARLEKVSIEWGGDWKSFKDGPHFQLPFAKYPK